MNSASAIIIHLLRKDKDKYGVWCTDPTQKRTVAELKFNNKDIRISLSKEKGQTVCVSL